MRGEAGRPSARLSGLAVSLARGTMASAEALLPDIFASLDVTDDFAHHGETTRALVLCDADQAHGTIPLHRVEKPNPARKD